MEDQQIRNRVVEKLLRKRVVGSHKKRVDTVKNWLPSHAQGRGEQLIREMVIVALATVYTPDRTQSCDQVCDDLQALL